MSNVVIFGAGGHGKVVLDILLESGHTVEGFLDGDSEKCGKEVCGYKVLGDLDYLRGKPDFGLCLGIGNNIIRGQVFAKASKMGVKVVQAIHPKATVSRSAKIGDGVVIMAHAVINPCATVETGVVINTGATVDHDCILKRFCHIWPGAHLAGTVTVGEFSYIGTGSAVIQNINIGNHVIIGAGAAVVTDIPNNVTAVGVPAKVIKQNRL